MYVSSIYIAISKFLLTRLIRGVTIFKTNHIVLDKQFLLTRLIRGVTLSYIKVFICIKKFLLTRLIRGVTACINAVLNNVVISTHTPHTRRDRGQSGHNRGFFISTHTPHTRRDFSSLRLLSYLINISTHTPHTRRDGG